MPKLFLIKSRYLNFLSQYSRSGHSSIHTHPQSRCPAAVRDREKLSHPPNMDPLHPRECIVMNAAMPVLPRLIVPSTLQAHDFQARNGTRLPNTRCPTNISEKETLAFHIGGIDLPLANRKWGMLSSFSHRTKCFGYFMIYLMSCKHIFCNIIPILLYFM